MNAKNKIFLVNSALMVALAIVSVFTAYVSSREVFKSQAQSTLSYSVYENANTILNSGGIVDDGFWLKKSEVYLSIYSSDKTLVNSQDDDFALPDYEIKKGQFQTAEILGEHYYVYDVEIVLVGRDSIYLRGVTKSKLNQANFILIVCGSSVLVVCLVLMFLSVLAGKKATKPLNEMTKSLSAIKNLSDLSVRLEVNKSDKDVYELEIAYNLMLERLEQLFKNQERLTSDVSHELRTPLTVILNEAEFALDGGVGVDEKNESLETIYRQTKKLVNIVNQLLEFSRFASIVYVELEPEDISQITSDCAVIAPNDKNISAIVDIEAGVTIKTEKTLYARLVQNLVDNAVKYGKNNGNVWISLKTESDKVVLSVKDNGIGMDSRTIDKIFNRFYQADTARSNGKGLGLGLSFVKEICRLLSADITVTSKVDEGSIFTVVFNK